MTANHNSFLKKNRTLKNDMPGWLFAMMRSLPELLIALLDMKNPPSLERLQLVGMDIALHDAHQNGDGRFLNVKLSPSLDSTDFLLLTGDLMVEGKKIVTLTITYFLRGQRQFFRVPPDDVATNTVLALPAIKHADIDQFLREMKESNSIFVDEKLMSLSGRPVFIPSHMMVWLMFDSIFFVNSSLRYKSFRARFFRAAPPGVLLFSYSAKADNFFATLADDEDILMSMSATR